MTNHEPARVSHGSEERAFSAHPRIAIWEGRVILLAQVHLVLSTLLLLLSVSAMWRAIAGLDQGPPTDGDLLGQLIHSLWSSALGVLSLFVAAYVAAMSLLLHISGWALLKRVRWAPWLTICVWWTLATPIIPAAAIMWLPSNWSPATLVFTAIVAPAPIVTMFLVLRPVQDVFTIREVQADNRTEGAALKAEVRIRGKAERARDRAAALHAQESPPRLD